MLGAKQEPFISERLLYISCMTSAYSSRSCTPAELRYASTDTAKVYQTTETAK